MVSAQYFDIYFYLNLPFSVNNGKSHLSYQILSMSAPKMIFISMPYKMLTRPQERVGSDVVRHPKEWCSRVSEKASEKGW